MPEKLLLRRTSSRSAGISPISIGASGRFSTLPSGQRLPFGIGVTVYRPLVAQTVTRDAATARALALSRHSELLAADSADRTMLEKHLETVVDAEGITLFCTVVCEEDVALTVEFESEDPFS